MDRKQHLLGKMINEESTLKYHHISGCYTGQQAFVGIVCLWGIFKPSTSWCNTFCAPLVLVRHINVAPSALMQRYRCWTPSPNRCFLCTQTLTNGPDAAGYSSNKPVIQKSHCGVALWLCVEESGVAASFSCTVCIMGLLIAKPQGCNTTTASGEPCIFMRQQCTF